MIIAADYPFLDIFWTMILFFLWVMWIWMLVVILTDVFRRRDISGWLKATWTFFLLVLPFLGVFVYLISQHDGMEKRRRGELAEQQARMDEYVRSVAGSAGPATELKNAQELLASGAITQAEFDTIKAKALASA